jgi:hypothetical protein
MSIVILTVQHMLLKKWISEDKMNGSCSMHVGYMKCINILLRPVWNGHPESPAHGLEVNVCLPIMCCGVLQGQWRYSTSYFLTSQ